MKKLREIARVHIARCEAGDMQAIKELADRLDGRPAQAREHGGPDSNPIQKIVDEIVHVHETREIEQRSSLVSPISILIACAIHVVTPWLIKASISERSRNG
jgi:hypothetical protein